jgi:hypothetical protein
MAMPTSSLCSLVEASCSSLNSIHIDGGEIMIDDPVANTVVLPDAVHTANIMPIRIRREFQKLREPRASRPEEFWGETPQTEGIEGGILLQAMESPIHSLCPKC